MILVTGALGFIGSNLAHALASQGQSLWLVDHLRPTAPWHYWQGLPVVQQSDTAELLTQLDSTLAQDCHAVYHLGACSATTETNWDYLRLNNIEYTQALWKFATRRQIPLIYASSAATYGDGQQGFDDATPPSKLKPLNLYGRSKNDFDAWALAQVATGQPAPPIWAGCKFFNVYGPREGHKGRMASVVWQAYQQIRQTGRVRLFKAHEPHLTDGGHQRDFVFVEDCLKHMQFLATGQAPNGIYNSGTGQPRTFLDLAKSVFAALGVPPQIEFIDMPEDLRGKYQSYTCANLSRLRAAGWTQPPTSLEEGCATTIRWLQTQDLT